MDTKIDLKIFPLYLFRTLRLLNRYSAFGQLNRASHDGPKGEMSGGHFTGTY